MKCYLMNQNKKITYMKYDEDSNTISHIYEIINIDYSPLSLYNAYKDKSKNLKKELNNWFRGRGIPSWRKDIERLLERLNISSTNEILAYNLSNSLAIELVTETVDKLVSTESFKLHKDAFIHSDQGVHYTSPRFQNLLKQNNLGQSMSRKGNCWDNAPQESFFGHMKDEIDYKSCNEFEELQIMVDDYMDYYNNFRCQWNLKKLNPVQFRNQLLMAA